MANYDKSEIPPVEQPNRWTNSKDQWGIISRTFHWVMALYILGMLSVGFYMASLNDQTIKGPLIWLHKSFGVIFLVLLILRLTWYASNIIPTIPPNRFHTLSKLSAPVLYLSMLIMPLSGALMSQAAGYPISVFGLFNLPTVVSKSPELAGVFFGIHKYSAFVLIGLIIIHTMAALYHHYALKDRVLRRMLISEKE